MRLKSRFLACAMLVVVLAMLANATLAFYTDAVETHNVITSGGIRISLDETVDAAGTPWQDVTNVMPGDTVPKIVTVTNEEQPAWIRVWVDIECRRAMPGGEMAKMQMNVQDFLGGRGNIAIDFNDTDWTYNTADGHFYYKGVLGTGKTTEPLFTQVVFDAKDMGNDWQNGSLTISVTAEAVQVANNAGAEGFTCPAKHEVDDRDARPEGDGENGEEKREDEPDDDSEKIDGEAPLPGANKPDGPDMPPAGSYGG